MPIIRLPKLYHESDKGFNKAVFLKEEGKSPRVAGITRDAG